MDYKIKLKNIKISNINVYYILTFILFITHAFLFHKIKPFQPLYFFYFPILTFFLIVSLIKRKIKVTIAQFLSLCCIIYWLVDIGLQQTFSFSQINVAISISYFFIGVQFLKHLCKEQVSNICKWTILISLIYISIETVTRLKGYLSLSSMLAAYSNMYIRGLLKSNSFMSIDSNMVAIYTMTLGCLSYYMYKYVEKSKFYIATFFASVLLTITTISRAALIYGMVSLLIIEGILFIKKHFFYFWCKKRQITLKFLVVIPTVFVLIAWLLYKIAMLFTDDYSLITKFELVQQTFNYIKTAPIYTVLFGLGTDLDIILKYFDRATHLLVTSYIVYYGFCSLILILSFWFQISKETHHRGLVIILPTLILGLLALSLPSCQTFYVSLAIIYYFEYILPRQEERSINAVSINNSSCL